MNPEQIIKTLAKYPKLTCDDLRVLARKGRWRLREVQSFYLSLISLPSNTKDHAALEELKSAFCNFLIVENLVDVKSRLSQELFHSSAQEKNLNIIQYIMRFNRVGHTLLPVHIGYASFDRIMMDAEYAYNLILDFMGRNKESAESKDSDIAKQSKEMEIMYRAREFNLRIEAVPAEARYRLKVSEMSDEALQELTGLIRKMYKEERVSDWIKDIKKSGINPEALIKGLRRLDHSDLLDVTTFCAMVMHFDYAIELQSGFKILQRNSIDNNFYKEAVSRFPHCAADVAILCVNIAKLRESFLGSYDLDKIVLEDAEKLRQLNKAILLFEKNELPKDLMPILLEHADFALVLCEAFITNKEFLFTLSPHWLSYIREILPYIYPHFYVENNDWNNLISDKLKGEKIESRYNFGETSNLYYNPDPPLLTAFIANKALEALRLLYEHHDEGHFNHDRNIILCVYFALKIYDFEKRVNKPVSLEHCLSMAMKQFAMMRIAKLGSERAARHLLHANSSLTIAESEEKFNPSYISVNDRLRWENILFPGIDKSKDSFDMKDDFSKLSTFDSNMIGLPVVFLSTLFFSSGGIRLPQLMNAFLQPPSYEQHVLQLQLASKIIDLTKYIVTHRYPASYYNINPFKLAMQVAKLLSDNANDTDPLGLLQTPEFFHLTLLSESEIKDIAYREVFTPGKYTTRYVNRLHEYEEYTNSDKRAIFDLRLKTIIENQNSILPFVAAFNEAKENDYISVLTTGMTDAEISLLDTVLCFLFNNGLIIDFINSLQHLEQIDNIYYLICYLQDNAEGLRVPSFDSLMGTCDFLSFDFFVVFLAQEGFGNMPQDWINGMMTNLKNWFGGYWKPEELYSPNTAYFVVNHYHSNNKFFKPGSPILFPFHFEFPLGYQLRDYVYLYQILYSDKFNHPYEKDSAISINNYLLNATLKIISQLHKLCENKAVKLPDRKTLLSQVHDILSKQYDFMLSLRRNPETKNKILAYLLGNPNQEKAYNKYPLELFDQVQLPLFSLVNYLLYRYDLVNQNVINKLLQPATLENTQEQMLPMVTFSCLVFSEGPFEETSYQLEDYLKKDNEIDPALRTILRNAFFRFLLIDLNKIGLCEKLFSYLEFGDDHFRIVQGGVAVNEIEEDQGQDQKHEHKQDQTPVQISDSKQDPNPAPHEETKTTGAVSVYEAPTNPYDVPGVTFKSVAMKPLREVHFDTDDCWLTPENMNLLRLVYHDSVRLLFLSEKNPLLGEIIDVVISYLDKEIIPVSAPKPANPRLFSELQIKKDFVSTWKNALITTLGKEMSDAKKEAKDITPVLKALVQNAVSLTDPQPSEIQALVKQFNDCIDAVSEEKYEQKVRCLSVLTRFRDSIPFKGESVELISRKKNPL